MWPLRILCYSAPVSSFKLFTNSVRDTNKKILNNYSSLLLLHSRHPSLTADSLCKGEVGGFPPHCVVASSYAVKTTVRMVVDIAQTINCHYRKANVIAFPPSYSHAIYRATLELISFHGDMDKVEWTSALETLREATWNYGRRWQAAGMYSSIPSHSSTDLNVTNIIRPSLQRSIFNPWIMCSQLSCLIHRPPSTHFSLCKMTLVW
jgi:hypothetical protein